MDQFLNQDITQSQNQRSSCAATESKNQSKNPDELERTPSFEHVQGSPSQDESEAVTREENSIQADDAKAAELMEMFEFTLAEAELER